MCIMKGWIKQINKNIFQTLNVRRWIHIVHMYELIFRMIVGKMLDGKKDEENILLNKSYSR